MASSKHQVRRSSPLTVGLGPAWGLFVATLAWSVLAVLTSLGIVPAIGPGWALPAAAATCGSIGAAALFVQIRRLVKQPLERVAKVIETCAVDRSAARCGPQNSRELQTVARAVDLLLDRVQHIETSSKAIVNAARDAILTINHRGIIQSFNPAAQEMFGYPAAAMIGRNVSRLMPEPHSRHHDDYIARYNESGVAKVLGFPREELALRSDGSTFPVSIFAARIDTGDGDPLFCGIIRDLSEQHQAEREVLLHAMQIEQANVELAQAKFEAEDARTQAEAANRSKSEFLANMSHEIRTPMTAIIGFAENLIEQNVLVGEQRQALETIARNGEHLMALINDILDLSKIEAGRLTVERIDFSPVRLVAEVASLMRVRADAKKLPLRVHFDGPMPSVVRSDPTRVRQVLINLVGNAIKFTAKGSVDLRVTMTRDHSGSPLLRFAVVDTGIGLDADQQQRLFRPFEQADSSTTRRFGGTGLGLNISKRLVEKLGGAIEVQSRKDHGSTFSFTIDPGPLTGVAMLADATEALTPPERAPEPPAEPARPSTKLSARILLAEDGLDNQRLIRFVLEKAGAKVEIVGDGKAAVDRLSDASGTPFDLVLMDMQMPIMDGYQATSELRRRGFDRPIVALTANAMAGDRERCLAAGCTEFSPKPVDRKALVETIARLVGS